MSRNTPYPTHQSAGLQIDLPGHHRGDAQPLTSLISLSKWDTERTVTRLTIRGDLDRVVVRGGGPNWVCEGVLLTLHSRSDNYGVFNKVRTDMFLITLAGTEDIKKSVWVICEQFYYNEYAINKKTSRFTRHCLLSQQISTKSFWCHLWFNRSEIWQWSYMKGLVAKKHMQSGSICWSIYSGAETQEAVLA